MAPPKPGGSDAGRSTFTESKPELHTELLILPDGQILVHNLTQPFAELLAELNPNCDAIVSRATNHELPG